MDLNRYRFTTTWHLPVPPDSAYGVLEDLTAYPNWWPGVASVRQLDERSGTLRVRALLPYALDVHLTQSRRDPQARVLEAAMTGDLEGFSRWTIIGADNGSSTATFEEDVVARKALLRRLALLGRPAFRANHWLMMRRGRRRLVAHLGASGSGHRRRTALRRP